MISEKITRIDNEFNKIAVKIRESYVNEQVNVFDGIMELGGIQNATGINVESTTLNRSANYNAVDSNSEYIFSNNGVATSANVFEYDENQNFLKYQWIGANNTLVTTENTKYIRFYKGLTDIDKIQIQKGKSVTKYMPPRTWKPAELPDGITDLIDDIKSAYIDNMNTNNFNADEGYIADSSNLPVINGKIRGNISQKTREGYNFIESKMVSATNNGVTCTNNGDGTFTLNGTATANGSFRIDQRVLNGVDNLKNYSSGNYTLLLGNTNILTKLVIMQNTTWTTFINTSINGLANVTLENEIDNCFSAILFENEVVFNNYTIKPMLLKGTYTAENLPSYEQYGQSPSIDYPSELNIVDGNYDISVGNKNMWKNNIQGTKYNCSVSVNEDILNITSSVNTGTELYFGNVDSKGTKYNETKMGQLFDVSKFDKVHLMISNSMFTKNFITFYDENKISLVFNSNAYSYDVTINTSEMGSKAHYICVRIGVFASTAHTSGSTYSTTVQLEQGSTATDYEPHKEQVISIDTTNRQLLNVDFVTQILNGILFKLNDDKKITIAGTSTASANILIADVTLQKGIYTIKGDNFIYAWGVSRLEITGLSSTIALYNGSSFKTFTLNEETTLHFRLIVSGVNTTVNYTISLLLTKGSQDLSYVKYTEEGSLNLFNKNNCENGYLTEKGIANGDSNYRTSDFIEVIENSNYYKTLTNSPSTKFYDKNKQPLNTTSYQDVSIGGSAGTFIVPNNAHYFKFSFPITGQNAIDIDTIMINEGQTAKPFTPYGIYSYPLYNIEDYYYKEDGKWYVHNEWGKYEFTGNESFVKSSFSSDERICVYGSSSIISNSKLQSDTKVSYSNIAKYGDYQYRNYDCIVADRQVHLGLSTDKIGGKEVSDLITYLKNQYDSGTPAYAIYELATPTETEIKNSILINQLNNLLKLKIYKGGTNISQVGNTEVLSKLDIDYIIDKDYIQTAILEVEPEL